jgi:2-oxoglutarate ferredoxin oxidoreductase subunit beta
MTTENTITVKDYSTREMPSWCPGCGDFGILTSLKKALVENNIPPHKTLLVAGIGCGSLIPYWLNSYGACTLHGRAIPFATGAKMANHKNNVIVNIGDGDGLGIGMGHFVHFFRRNINMMVICDNNGVYGLTKGQTAPTAPKGSKTSSTPFGSIEDYVNGPALALQMGATFVARAYSADAPGLTEIMKQAMNHKGAAFVDILQPCVTFNKTHGYDFYNERIEKNDLDKPLCAERNEAIMFCNTHQEKIPTGIIYKEEAPSYEDQIPQFNDGALVEQEINNIDVSGFMDSRA